MIPAITNHLWQSTLFAAVAALLTLPLRKNRAETRYRLWLAASMKFLVPFSLLVMIGGHLGWRTAPASAQPSMPKMAFVIEQASQPFVAPLVNPPVPAPAEVGFGQIRIIEIVWALGFLAVLAHWLLRWLRIRTVLRSSLPLKLDFPARVRTSTSLIAPGVCGVFRPILLLPAGITERIAAGQLRAILVHELTHIRRRDNLTGFIHMLVEAVFWFHPLVWWIGTRLVEERERACDEAVLLNGTEPEVYAEGILNVCKLYVESPLACVAGVTGSDLKSRIEKILLRPAAIRLSVTRRAALAAAGMAAVAVPIAVGIIHAQSTRKFAVVSIKPCAASAPAVKFSGGKNGGGGGPSGGRIQWDPSSLRMECTTTEDLIRNAYLLYGDGKPGPSPNAGEMIWAKYFGDDARTPQSERIFSRPIQGAPSWIGSVRYTVDAKSEAATGKEAMLGPMMQAVLEERFKLSIHRASREVPIYNLTVAKGGPRLQPAREGSCVPFDQVSSFPVHPDQSMPHICGLFWPAGEGKAVMNGATMADLCNHLSNMCDRDVVDKTGIAGAFDMQFNSLAEAGANDPGAKSALIDGILQKLGLRLEPAKGRGEFLVIEHVEKPSEN